ncbi:MAG: hypothetical protein AXA67_02185 [Methylothermaceae bacteria B42]|nr:MAG: hypothetical protein AXA67_02185 [Methylothermaceae bacteria B42]HHJ40071.1 hypothetical protein [Methylothermaceae bacterium]
MSVLTNQRQAKRQSIPNPATSHGAPALVHGNEIETPCKHCHGQRYVRLRLGHAPCAHCNPFF